MRTKSSDEGFTLLELLVTCMIIGVLAGIAIPVFLHVRARSYEAAMKSDLKNAVTAENAYTANHPGYTIDVTDLGAEGYRTSPGVTPVHVVLVGTSFVACVKHSAAPSWLVYDGSNGSTTSSPSDCA